MAKSNELESLQGNFNFYFPYAFQIIVMNATEWEAYTVYIFKSTLKNGT